MNSFPLYNILADDLPKKDLTLQEKKSLISSLDLFDAETKELVFVIIKYHYLQNHLQTLKNKKESYVSPYSGKLSSHGVTFNLLEFPVELRQMLYKFACLHKKKLTEDEEKNRSTLSEAD